MASKPLKWHGGKDYMRQFIQDTAPQMGTYTHRGIVCAGSLSEFWNWPHDGISEVVNDKNEHLVNFYSVLGNPHLRAQFLDRVYCVPLSDRMFNAAKWFDENVTNFDLTNGASVDLALAFFVRYRQSRQGLGKDFCTPTKRVRGGMNENVSAWLGAVDGLWEASERMLRAEIVCMCFRNLLAKYDHKNMLWFIDPPYWGPQRASFGEYGEHEFQPWDHSFNRHDGQDLYYMPVFGGGLPSKEWASWYVVSLTGAKRQLGLLDIVPHLKGKFMLCGYHSTLYDTWAELYGFKCHEKQVPNSSSSSGTKEIKTECIWTNY